MPSIFCKISEFAVLSYYFCSMKATTIPAFLRLFYPSLHWKMPEGENKIYLTFDDGPHPEITPEVLKMLEPFDAKATFFCVGENVQKFPETYKKVVEAGHLTANHTFNHLNGWKTPLNLYYENVSLAQQLIQSDWFRPPYGRITPMQIQALKKEYKIVMWSVLSYDFDAETTVDQCISNVMAELHDGAIIVFHDSAKALKNMLPALQATLEAGQAKGLRFSRLDE